MPFFKEALAIRIDLQVLLKLHTHKIDLGLELPIVKLTFSQLCCWWYYFQLEVDKSLTAVTFTTSWLSLFSQTQMAPHVPTQVTIMSSPS